MLAQALVAGGVWGGRSDEMLSPQPDNPLGFFERRDVVELNEHLLELHDGSWFSPPEIPLPPPAGVLQQRIRKIVGALLESRPENSDIFVKDPRMCLTWSLWKEFLPKETIQLYAYREPASVALSLQRRHGFPIDYGLCLWGWYNRKSLEILQSHGGLVMAYERIAANPEDELTGLFSALRSEGVNIGSPEDTLYLKELHHVGQSADELKQIDGFLTPEQKQLADYCRQVAASKDRRILAGEVPASLLIQLSITRLRLSDYTRTFKALADATEARKELTERTEERDYLHTRLTQREADIEALAQVHAEEQLRNQELLRNYNSLHEDHKALAAAHEREVAESREQRKKAEYLFGVLSGVYQGLLSHRGSYLGRLQAALACVYKLVTFRRGRSSREDELLSQAQEFCAVNGMPTQEKENGKWTAIYRVLRYMLKNPYSTVRSVSWQRFVKAVSMFRHSSRSDFQIWVEARFPDQVDASLLKNDVELDGTLDTLRLAFPDSPNPTVSIVVPVYNNYRVTVNCLRSILDHTQDVSYELIIADDQSSDLTSTIEDRIDGIRIARTSINSGFLKNCNHAAGHARGDFVLLLNNDTVVTPQWLSALLKPFDDPDVGVVGPKLLFSNGKLQEAGGIVWKDASAWNYGRADDPEKPHYNYRKEVDYISGACLLVRRSLWEQLGGFDERFVPAYYEDTDFCFAARNAGYKVIYQPVSRVFHYEGLSNGTDTNSGLKSYQIKNQNVFREKWAAMLEAEHFPNAKDVVLARDRSRQRQCILVIDHYVPHWDKDAGSRSTFGYLKTLLNMGFRVQFMGANFFPHDGYTQALQNMGVEVLVGESIAKYLHAWFEENVPYIDRIMIHRPHIAEQFLPLLEKLNECPPVWYFGHDLHYLRVQRQAELIGKPQLYREAEEWRARELRICSEVAEVFYFSQVEIEALRKELPDIQAWQIPLYSLPTQSIPLYEPPSQPAILFVGGFNHPPNSDAVSWFVSAVWPIILSAIPDCQFHVVGSNPTSEVMSLGDSHVKVHGFVSDEVLDSLYGSSTLAVVPLRYGAGVKGKVIEAVQQGVPIVTTSIGAEGLPDPESVMWVVEDASAMAEVIVDIVKYPEHAANKLQHYAEWLEGNFSQERATRVLAEAMSC